MKLPATALFVLLLGMPPGVVCQNVGRRTQTGLPPTPASVRGVLYARRFTLSTPYTNTWSKERPRVTAGVLIVVEVDPAYVVPRDTLEPVLYAGDFAVQRLNQGYESGRVVGIVPGNLDLASAPIWFGSPQLPERVTESTVRAERARAERAGVRALPQARAAGVERPSVAARDLAALLREVAADLVNEYSPREKHLADSWRLPEAKAPPTRKPD